MSKKLWLIGSLVVVIALAIAAVGASWSVVTTATGNNYKAANFDMTILGQHTANGICNYAKMAPGDDAVPCVIPLHNGGDIDINVVFTGFQLTGDPEMCSALQVTDIADGAGQTHLSDLVGYDTNHDGVYSLSEVAVVLGNGYYSNPNGTYGPTSVFIAPDADSFVSMTIKFPASAGNETINKQCGFNWTLTALQMPKNP